MVAYCKVLTVTRDTVAPARPDIEVVRPTSILDADARFDQFCRDHYATVANALGWALGSHDLGREATDEAFVRAYERWDRVEPMANAAGWVYRVGLNWGRRRIWRTNRERELLNLIELEDHNDRYLDQDLAQALRRIPIKFRSVIILRYLLGYSERETAEALGISPGTAKSRTSRGLDRLRAHLDSPTEEHV